MYVGFWLDSTFFPPGSHQHLCWISKWLGTWLITEYVSLQTFNIWLKNNITSQNANERNTYEALHMLPRGNLRFPGCFGGLGEKRRLNLIQVEPVRVMVHVSHKEIFYSKLLNTQTPAGVSKFLLKAKSFKISDSFWTMETFCLHRIYCTASVYNPIQISKRVRRTDMFCFSLFLRFFLSRAWLT